MGGHEDRTHAKYSPSQAERFLNCPGSVALLEKVPAREQSPYAIEGTKAHEILECALRHGVRRAIEAHREYSSLCMEDFEDPKSFYYSVQVALNYIYAILDENSDAILYNETRVNPPLPSAPNEGAGYADVAIHIPSKRVLYVIDYKHGAGVAKAARDNPQPLQYAAGFLYGDNAPVDPSDIDTVVIVIIQPRAFHADGAIRDVELTPYEVYEYLDVLDKGVAACQSATAPLNPGSHCHDTFCDARTICPAREAMALSKAVNTTFRTIYDVKRPDMPNVELMDVNRLSYIAQAAPMLRKFLDDVDKHIDELLRIGYAVPGFKLVETQARRRWYGDESEVAFKLAALANVDVLDLIRTEMIGITEAERLVVEAFKARVGRGKKKQAAEDAKRIVAQLTLKQSSGATKVVPEDDPAPAVNRAATDFNGVGLIEPPTVTGNTDG